MINQQNISEILKSYDLDNLTVAVLGGHSALDVCRGAKKMGFRTLAVCQKGREKTYAKYYRTRQSSSAKAGDLDSRNKSENDSVRKGCIDEIILVDKFSDVVKPEIQEQLRSMNAIFIHNRYFWVYFKDFKDVKENFQVPIFGNRTFVELEERDVEKNQYYLLEKAGIRLPKIFKTASEIDRLALVKVNEANRGYERAFFFASSEEDFKNKSQEMIAAGTITQEALDVAVIEEYILGAHVNFNYFYSPITDELELMGTDTRRQTSLDGLLRLPADIQLEVLKHVQPKIIETGHYGVTTKESIIEKAFDIGEKFVQVTKDELGEPIIGPFALQGAVASFEGKEEIVIFDVSMRIPGSPGTRFTPYSGYLYGESLSYGERIGMEIKQAIAESKLDKLLT